MKSIIIIIAIFLVTLTAKADWVKSGELDSLYLGDAPITFSKYSPDYTKFVTYSAQDSTLRLWDLGTGKVIKERTFGKSYKYDLYEFDFKYEQLYFTNIKNEVTYANSIESQQLTYPVSTISFTDSITIIITASSNRYVGKYSGGTQYNLQSIKLVNSCLHIFYQKKYWESDPKNYSETISYIAIIVENNGVSYKVINKILNQPFKFYFYNNSFIYYLDNYKGFYISRNDSIIYLSFDNKVTTKNYQYIYTKMEFIDYEYETISFSDSNNNIKLYSFNEDQIIDYEIPIVSSKIRNFKLISSPKYSIFYQDSSRLSLCDNQLKKLIDTIYLPEGKIGFSNSTNYTYSFIANRIFRNKFNNMLEEYDDIFTDLLYYRTTDSVTLLKNINQKDSNLIWKVNGNLYYGNKPKFNIDKAGFYKVELTFERNGKKYFVERDSFITVLAPSDIQDYTDKKYIFKQDAEGIYCQLEGEGEVSLYDNVGRLVRTYQIENERYIRKEDLERGVYFLQINVNGNVYHEKVLVE